MGFIQAQDSDIYHEEEGEGRPIILTHPAAFRETAYRRWRRQATTLCVLRARDVRARRRIRGVTLLRSTLQHYATSSRLLPRTRVSSGCQ